MHDVTILLASDDVLTQWGLADYLASAGVEVVGACRASRIGELLAERPDYDLLLIDVELPGSLGGLDIANRWRQALPGRPIIFAAAHRSSLVRPLHADETFLAIPLDPPATLEAIQDAIGDSMLRAPAGMAAASPSHLH